MTDTNFPLVSILTPVFNGGNYLAHSIDSVLAQSFESWELVLIDNGSTDSTPELIEQYKARDNRIRSVRNPTTVPVIENHNIALTHMSADSLYCKVLHADDWMEPDCLSEMVALADLYPSTGVIGSWAQWGERVMSQIETDGTPVFPGVKVLEETLLGKYYPFLSPSCLLIRSDLLRERGFLYRSGHLHADVEAAFELLRSTDFGLVEKILTHVRSHDESVTSASALPLNTLLGANLELLAKYGPCVLKPDLYAAAVENRLRRYYRILARAVLERRKEDYWRYHKQSMARAGMPLSRRRLARIVLRQFARQPVVSIRRILGWEKT